LEDEVGVEAVVMDVAAPVRNNLEGELVVEAVATELVAAAVHKQEHEVVPAVVAMGADAAATENSLEDGEVVAGVAVIDVVSSAAQSRPQEASEAVPVAVTATSRAQGMASFRPRRRWGA
jgi:hypothetical protein